MRPGGSRRPRASLGLMAVATVLFFAAFGALAFATALRPHGYDQASDLVLALALGIAAFLVVFLILRSLFRRLLHARPSRVRYLALAIALGVFVAGGGVRSLAIGTGSGDRRARLAQERQDFDRWTQAAVPLIVRYGDAVRVDAPLIREPRPRRATSRLLRARVERAERSVRGVRRSSRPLIAAAPADLRSYTPLLRRALALAVAAQRTYAAGLSRGTAGLLAGQAGDGRSSAALIRRGTRRLRTSQKAIAAFTEQVNSVGAQLSAGRLPSAPGGSGGDAR